MATPIEQPEKPLQVSLENIQKELQQLKKLGVNGNSVNVWQTAGRIWDLAQWISNVSTDSQVRTSVRSIRSALSELILATRRGGRPTEQEAFEEALATIASACGKIRTRVA
jgi:hypothetical protein